jgi:hypothetical protein
MAGIFVSSSTQTKRAHISNNKGGNRFHAKCRLFAKFDPRSGTVNYDLYWKVMIEIPFKNIIRRFLMVT